MLGLFHGKSMKIPSIHGWFKKYPHDWMETSRTPILSDEVTWIRPWSSHEASDASCSGADGPDSHDVRRVASGEDWDVSRNNSWNQDQTEIPCIVFYWWIDEVWCILMKFDVFSHCKVGAKLSMKGICSVVCAVCFFHWKKHCADAASLQEIWLHPGN
jgi:hypothetical protein